MTLQSFKILTRANILLKVGLLTFNVSLADS
jgi:hypothetical protein